MGGVPSDEGQGDGHTGERERRGQVVAPAPRVDGEAGRNGLERQRHQGEPGDELPPNSPTDDVEQ